MHFFLDKKNLKALKSFKSMIWAITIQRDKGQYKIVLPKKWIKDNTNPEDKILFLEEIEKGIAHAYIGKVYYDKRISKPADAPDSGTGEPGQNTDGQERARGVSGFDEVEGPAPADFSEEGK